MKLFSWETTLALAALGWLTAFWLRATGRSSKYVMLPAYFALIETLQLLQYLVLDQCHTKTNQALTLLAYAHVAFQPLIFNEFVWGQPQAAFNRPIITPYADSVMHKSIRRLCLAGAGLFLFKAAPAFVKFAGVSPKEIAAVLGPRVARFLAGTNTWCDGRSESFCGRQLCSFKGRTHIGWVLPMLPHSYYIPTGFLHLFLMFVPALVMGGTPQRIMALAALVTGPVAASQLIDGDRPLAYEWASSWSFFSVAQVLLLFVVELIVSKILMGRSRLPPADQKLGQGFYPQRTASEAETEATAIIHLYQQQLAGYKGQLGGYNKLH